MFIASDFHNFGVVKISQLQILVKGHDVPTAYADGDITRGWHYCLGFHTHHSVERLSTIRTV